MNPYIGHESQLSGVEEHRLVGGQGDGMRLYQIRNGMGLEMTVSADRCADISRLSYKGDNLGFFSPCGYVAPQYYDDKDAGFLKSFTAGFLTTCGLTAVGSACTDEGEALPLHGRIHNAPAENIHYECSEDNIEISAKMREAALFGHKLLLERKLICSKKENVFSIHDTVKNIGAKNAPLMILYHINIGYPLLDESAELFIPSSLVMPRNERAKEGIKEWHKLITPQKDFEEQCYYHRFDGKGFAAIYNNKIEKGLSISFDNRELNEFVQWKIMGEGEYALGLEPANCKPDGRDVQRREGKLQFIAPNEQRDFTIHFQVLEKGWIRES